MESARFLENRFHTFVWSHISQNKGFKNVKVYVWSLKFPFNVVNLEPSGIPFSYFIHSNNTGANYFPIITRAEQTDNHILGTKINNLYSIVH